MFRRITPLILCAAVAACSDAVPTNPVGPAAPDEHVVAFRGPGVFRRYVAMGTSISMGTASDGTRGASQKESWVAQLAGLAGHDIELPLISGTGCRAPFQAPLASGVRISGEPVTTPAASLGCSPLEPGVTLPTRNVAIAAATTLDALVTTPETQADPFYRKLYPLVLPPNTTQLAAMRLRKPLIVSVEFGANELFSAVSGVAIPGATIFPYSKWLPLYTALVDSVAMVSHRVILVGLIRDVGSFPGFRLGSELWADRGTFLAAFNVSVSADCDASPNLVFVPVRVPTAVSAGLTRRAQGLSPAVFSCTGGGQGVQDYVLTPAEAGVVNAQMTQMNADIAAIAAHHGFAHFELDALYGRSDLKGSFNAVQLMTSGQPYGPLVSLDGIHPSGAGQTILAYAAAQAVNDTYHLGLNTPAVYAAR
jgi:hypothetical protein